MHRKQKSKIWLYQHINDPYVKLAQQQGYRARGAYKLLELDKQLHLVKPGMVVVDLGSSPGSWCQVVRERLGKGQGRILALDMLPMLPLEGVEFLQGDFREESVMQALSAALGGVKIDLVLSDMAPNLSGVSDADTARIGHVCELALEFALQHLKPSGSLVVKAFHGSGFSQLVQDFKHVFIKVIEKKPAASRAGSAETYLVGRQLKPVAANVNP